MAGKKRGDDKELLGKLKSVVAELERSQPETEVFEQQLAEKSQIIEALKEEIDVLKKKSKPSEDKIKNALKQNVILERNLVSKTELLRELKQENQDIMTQQEMLEKDLFKQNKINNDLLQNIELLKQQIEQKDQQVKHLNMDIKAFDEKLADARKVIGASKQQTVAENNKVMLLDDQNKSLLLHLSKAKETIENLTATIDSLNRDLDEKTASILQGHAKAELDFKMENEMLRNRIQELQSLIEQRDRRQNEIIQCLSSSLNAARNV